MNSTIVSHGELVCWSTDWKDITKFLLFNFVLHAITALSSPGDGILLGAFNKFIGLSMPLCGMGKAITTIYRFSYGQKTPLAKALRAGALCRVVPERKEITFGEQLKDVFRCFMFVPLTVLATIFRCPSLKPNEQEKSDPVGRLISTTVKTVHGQHPVSKEGNWRWVRDFIHQRSTEEDFLVIVPQNFKVREPLIGGGELEISYNYSLTKAVAAIVQMLYGIIQLSDSARPQIAKFGYNTYQLTIIPYVMMSFLNLIATACEPQFPALYLVDSESRTVTTNTEGVTETPARSSLENGVPDGPKISCVVGTITGDSDTEAKSLFNTRKETFPVKAWCAFIGCSMLGIAAILTPYLVIWFVTKFERGEVHKDKQDPDNQSWDGPDDYFDGWVVLWLAYGQIYSLLVFLPGLNSNPRPAFKLFRTLLFLSSTIFALCYVSFVVRVMIWFMVSADTCMKV